jgi:hypothetical protein
MAFLNELSITLPCPEGRYPGPEAEEVICSLLR